MPDAIRYADYAGRVDAEIARSIIISEASHLAPIFLLAQSRGLTQVAKATEVSWYGQTIGITRTAVNGGAFNAATTSLTVDDASGIVDGNLVKFEITGEISLVEDVSGNTLTLRRGAFGTTALTASVADDAPLRVIGSPRAEGSGIPGANIGTKTKYETQVATFREAIKITGTAARTQTITEDERGFQTIVKTRELMRDIDQQFLYSEMGEETVGGEIVRTMQGLLGILSNQVAIGGALSENGLYAGLEPMLAHGAPVKVLAGGPTFLNALQTIFGQRLRQSSSDIVVGLPVRRISFTHGEVEVIPHRGLSGNYAGTAVVLDPDNLALRHTDEGEKSYGGLPHVVRNIEEKGDDATIDAVCAELCLTWGDDNTHGVLTGVTGAA